MGSSPAGRLSAAARHDRNQVVQIAGPRVGGVHTVTWLGQTARVHRRQHVGRQIGWQADQFAHHRRGDDSAVILSEVELAARQQHVQPFVGELANPFGQLADVLGRNGPEWDRRTPS